jgi:hypothetical protein
MGFFSWLCAATGLPILYSGIDHWGLSRVVVIGPSGTVTGTYDGYGRVTADDGFSFRLPLDKNYSPVGRLVIAEFYDPKQHTFDALKPNAPDPNQGYFWDDSDLVALYQRAKQEGTIPAVTVSKKKEDILTALTAKPRKTRAPKGK